MECFTFLSANYQVVSRNAKGIYPLTSPHTQTQTLYTDKHPSPGTSTSATLKELA